MLPKEKNPGLDGLLLKKGLKIMSNMPMKPLMGLLLGLEVKTMGLRVGRINIWGGRVVTTSEGISLINDGLVTVPDRGGLGF